MNEAKIKQRAEDLVGRTVQTRCPIRNGENQIVGYVSGLVRKKLTRDECAERGFSKLKRSGSYYLVDGAEAPVHRRRLKVIS